MRAFAFLMTLIGIASAKYCPLKNNNLPGDGGGPVGGGPVGGGPVGGGPVGGGPIGGGPVSVGDGGGTGFATHFEGLGIPYGGCGVPQSWLVDGNGKELPFVALNTQLSSFAVPAHEEPIPNNLLGLFDNGKNCGRWLKIVLKETCKRGSNTNDRVCIVGNTYGVRNYEPDVDSGKIVYGYVADKCSDVNVWCRTDKYHIDISTKSIEQYVKSWGNRLVTWDFISGSPPEYKFGTDISFGWAQDAYIPYYASLIIYNVNNGISRVNVKSKLGAMTPARPNGILGQMWVLPWESDTKDSQVVVEVFDVSGSSYGIWSVNFPCGSKCLVPTKANAKKSIY